MSSYYFAYGSNMNPHRMALRGMQVEALQPGRLHNLHLAFNKCAGGGGRAHANVVYRAGAMVEGVLYRLSGAGEIARMDPFENAPRSYSRDIFHIETDAGSIPGWVYIANRASIGEGLSPSREYLAHLLAGRDFLSSDYYARLARTRCA